MDEINKDNVVTPPIHKIKKNKEKIPAALRNSTWVTYMGNIAEGKCCCCKIATIWIGNFECGHVVAESKGGKTSIGNLRPVCGGCNKSMGVRNMEEFMQSSGFGELNDASKEPTYNDDIEKLHEIIIGMSYMVCEYESLFKTQLTANTM